MKSRLLLLTGFVLGMVGVSWAAPTVVSHSPTKNALNISKSTNITVDFSESMNQASLTGSNIKAYGSISGFHSGSIEYDDGTKTLTFNPANDFLVGETVNIILTPNIQNSSNESLAAQYSWKFTVSVSASSGAFNSSTTDYATGTDPISSAIADVDGANGLDILVANYTSNTVSVFLNQGDGTFASKVDYATNTRPNAIIAADLNGDGKIDIATTNLTTDNISVLINNGDGTFAAKVDYVTGTNPDNLVAGDVDGDGDIDLVCTNSGTTTISVLDNNGNGTFATKVDYPVLYNPHGITLGDVDNDGDPDLMVLTWNTGSLNVLMNNGNGTFASAVEYSTVVTPRNLATCDLDNDGYSDIVTANGFANSISFYKNNGDGTFASKVDYTVGSNAFSITAFDLDGDGDLDIAVPSANDGYVSVFKNNGSGVLSDKVDYTSSGNIPLSTNTADLDNDGDLEMVYVNQISKTLSVRFSIGTPPKVTSTSPSKNALNVAANSSISATFDKNVSTTLSDTSIVVRGSQTGVHSGDFSYSSGTLTASFNPTEDFIAGEVVTVTVKSGIEGDLTTASDKAFSWSFTIKADTGSVNYRKDLYTGSSDGDPQGVAVADFNGDGIYDIAATTNDFTDEPHSYISIFSGTEKGTFSDKVSYEVSSSPYGLTAVDVNGDGHADLITANYVYSGTISVLINNGDGTFASNVTYPTSNYPDKIINADVDGDGDVDLMVTNKIGNSISVLQNNGSGNFSSRVDYVTGASPYGLAVADFDNDGDNDLIVSLYGSNVVTLLKNNGSGSFSSGGNLTTANGPYDLTVADVNDDGLIDIMTGNQSATNMSVFINNGNGTYAGKVDYTIGNVPDIVRAGDFDGDGDIDVIVANRTTNKLSIFYNNDDGTFAAIQELASGSSITDMVFNDVDGNGTLDIIFSDKGSDNISVIKHFPVSPKVTSVFPIENKLNVSKSVSITATFDKEIVTSTLSNNSILVNGSISGKHTGSITYDSGNSTVTFDPSSDFSVGEVVTVNLTTRIKGILASALEKAYSWSFTVNADTGVVYENKVDYPTATNPGGIASADFDRDGRLDLAVVNNTSSTVSIFIAKDDTSFEVKVDYTVASDPWFVTTGDLNADGYSDIIVASNGTHKLSVLLNNGDGTFANKVDYATAFNPHIGIPADLDGDGDLDLVSSNYSSASVSVLMNNGNGTFASRQDYGTGSNPYHVAVGDVNGDGLLDLVVANSNSSSVSVLKNNGDGTFAGKVDYPAATNPVYSIISDLDNDGKMDIAVVNYGSQSLSVLINQSNTSFASKVDYAVGTNPFVLNSADVDGDGDIDLIVTNITTNDLSLLKNIGDGTFATKITLKTGNSPRGTTVVDFDNDGDMDIVATNSGSNTFSIFINAQAPPTVSAVAPTNNQLNVNSNSSITFTFDISMTAASISSNSVKVFGSKKGYYSGIVSFNGGTKTGTFDPSTDFEPGELITVTITKDVKSSELSHMLNAYSWNFIAKAAGNLALNKKVDFASGTNPFGIISSDIDGDGDMDIVLSNTGSTNISVLKNEGDTTFATKTTYTVASDPWGVASADLNADGYLDLIAASNGSHKVSVLLNDQSGSFASKVDYTTGSNPHIVIPADINGDGSIDLVTSNWGSHNISVLINNGDATFATKVDYSTGSNPWEIQISDIDNDGDLDVISTNSSTTTVSVLKNNGDGTYAGKTDYTVGTNPWGILVNDVNGDGYSDILATNNSSTSFSVLMNNQNGSFAEKVDYTTSTNPFGINVIDLEGDGDLDVLVANYGTTKLSVFKNNGDGTFGVKQDYETGTQPSYIATADIDGDNDLDIILTNKGSATLSIFKNTVNPPSVSSVTPASNALHVSRSSTITVTFDRLMKASTLNKNTIVVSGSQTGMYDGTVSFDENTFKATYTPAKNFKAGEKISVTVSSATESSVGSQLVKTYNWSFITKADTGGGSFGKPTYIPLIGYPETFTVTDFDGDGFVDFGHSEASDSVSIRYNNGNGTFSSVFNFPMPSPKAIISEDLNNDMKPDLIATSNYSNTNVSVLNNLGNRNFDSKISYGTGTDYSRITTADLDGNGFKDLILNIEDENKLTIIKNSGNGVFGSQVDYLTSEKTNSFSSIGVQTADLDSDGDIDVVTTNNGSDTISVFFNDGNGILTEKSNISVGVGDYWSFYYFTVADIDGDGDVDILLPVQASNYIAILKNNGNGTFAPKADVEVANYPGSVIAMDIDGDGDLDLITNNWDNDDFSILVNTGDGTFEPHKEIALGQYTETIASGDFNNDGKMDFAATSSDDNNRIYIFLNNSSVNPTDGSFTNVSFDSVKTLTGNLSVSGILSVAAQITTGSNTIDLGSTGSLSGETPSNYIQGKVQSTRTISSAQENIAGLGISIDPQTNNLGNTTIKRETGSSVNAGSIKQIWTITPETQPSGPVTVTLTWPASNDNSINLNDLVVYKSSDGTATWNVVSAVINKDSDPRTATFTITSFSIFTIGESAQPLPVELSSFTASIAADGVKLNWSTTTETTNSGWEIEQRLTVTGETGLFRKVGFVAGKGTTTEAQSYSFNVAAVKANLAEFRLKQIDMDGKSTYSQILSVEVKPAAFELSQNYPNPFNPATTIRYSVATEGRVSLSLYNALGQKIKTLVQENQPAGFYSLQLNVGDLSSGVYFYVLEAASFKSVKKLTLLK